MQFCSNSDLSMIIPAVYIYVTYADIATLPPSCAIVMKSGNLNFLEPSAPLQTCNGTNYLTLTLTLCVRVRNFIVKTRACIGKNTLEYVFDFSF